MDSIRISVISLMALLIFFPVAVAGQNIVAALTFLTLTFLLIKNPPKINFSAYFRLIRIPVFIYLSFLIFLCLSTLLNDRNDSSILKFLVGQITFVSLPILFSLLFLNKSKKFFEGLSSTLVWVCIIMGVLSISQYLFGWKISGTTLVDAPPRARGLYSHPLTFAYACLLLWPYCVVKFLKSPKKLISCIPMVFLSIALFTSESRTVLFVALLVFLSNVFILLRGRQKILAIAVSVFCVSGVMFTENPVSNRIFSTFSEEGLGRYAKEYPDDRLAFWHVHWNMVAERPVLGHGIGLNTAYRVPYYDEIGLHDFIKKYEAHNQYLQVATNGGIIALVLFLYWFGWYLITSFSLRKSGITMKIVFQCFLSVSIAAITQNAYQDSEVRYGMMLLMIVFFVKYTDLNKEKLSAS